MKLRPFDPAMLSAHCAGYESEAADLKVEVDWTGDSRVVAASLVTSQPANQISEFAKGRSGPRKLLSDDQERFYNEYGGAEIDWPACDYPGRSTRSKVKAGDAGFHLELAVERWAVDDLRFLGLSVRTEHPAKAERAQSEFKELLEDKGLFNDVVPETKTRRVLKRLGAKAGGQPEPLAPAVSLAHRIRATMAVATHPDGWRPGGRLVRP